VRIFVHPLAVTLQYLAVYVRNNRGITEDGKFTLNLGNALLRNKGAIFMRLKFPGDRKLVLASAHLPMKGEDESPWEIGLKQRKDAFKEIVDFLAGKAMFSGPKKANNWVDRTAIIFTGDTNMRVDDKVGDQLTSLMAGPVNDNPFYGWKEGGQPPDFFTCRFEKKSLFSGDSLAAYTSCRSGAGDYALPNPTLARKPADCETRSGCAAVAPRATDAPPGNPRPFVAPADAPVSPYDEAAGKTPPKCKAGGNFADVLERKILCTCA
jgi:hypothetical protein